MLKDRYGNVITPLCSHCLENRVKKDKDILCSLCKSETNKQSEEDDGRKAGGRYTKTVKDLEKLSKRREKKRLATAKQRAEGKTLQQTNPVVYKIINRRSMNTVVARTKTFKSNSTPEVMSKTRKRKIERWEREYGSVQGYYAVVREWYHSIANLTINSCKCKEHNNQRLELKNILKKGGKLPVPSKDIKITLFYIACKRTHNNKFYTIGYVQIKGNEVNLVGATYDYPYRHSDKNEVKKVIKKHSVGLEYIQEMNEGIDAEVKFIIIGRATRILEVENYQEYL